MIRLIFVAFILFTIASCARSSWDKKTFDDETLNRFVSGSVTRSLVSLDGNDTSALSINYEYYLPVDSVFKDSVNQSIAKYVKIFTYFGNDSTKTELNPEFFEKQADLFVEMYDEEKVAVEFGSVWELESDFSINDEYPTFVELNVAAWSYTGGAHGNGSFTTHHILKETGQLLYLDDFFTNVEELNTICEPHFRKLLELAPEDDLQEAGFWFDNNVFSVNNNFYFADGQITFYYNTYEITSYAGGPIELVIPITEIKHLLKRAI